MDKKSWNKRRSWKWGMENRCAEMLKRQGVTIMPEEDLKEAAGEAWSIGANNQPEDPEYIGSAKTEHGVYHYFKDIDGRFYFLSSRIMEFDREMREAQERGKALRRMKK